MGLLIPEPKLEPGERILWQSPASLTSVRPMVGGTLYVTNNRVMLVPNRLNYWRGTRKPRAWPRTQIQSIGVQDRDFTPYTGGMHNRMQITLTTGEQLLFVVRHPDEAVGELQSMLAGRQ
jgi:hypothetical protein